MIALPYSMKKKAKIIKPVNFFYFLNDFPKKFKKEVLLCYQKIFSEPPWSENWEDEEVLRKLEKELKGGKSFLSIMLNNQNNMVVGLCWGAIINPNNIKERIDTISNESLNKLENYLEKRGIDKVLFFDELGILKNFRGGVNPLRFLTLPGFEIGYKNNVKQAIFWSTPASKIVPFMKLLGFKTIIKEGKIVILYSRNFTSVLKIARNIKAGWLMGFLSKI